MARLLSLAAMLSLAPVLPAQDGEFIERTGDHFRVVFHAGDLPAGIAGVLAEEALAKVESFWPVLHRMFGAKGRDARPIHLYRRAADYLRVERASPQPPGLESFVTPEGVAHVRLWPELREELLLHTGVPQSTVDLLLRVAAEQVVKPLLPGSEVDDWLECVLVHGAVEAAANPEHRPGVDAAYDKRRMEIIYRRVEGRTLTLEDALQVDLKARERTDWDFARNCCAIVAQAMAEVSPRWPRKLLRKPKKPKPPFDDFELRRAAASAVFGRNFTKAGLRFAGVIRGIEPVWDLRSPLFVPRGETCVLAGTRDTPARVQAGAPPPAGDYVIASKVEMLGAQLSFRVWFGWDGKTEVGVLLWPGQVAISVWDSEARKWLQQAHEFSKDEAGWGKEYDLRIEVTATEVRVAIDGVRQVAWQHGGREVHAYWGMSVNEGLVNLTGLGIAPLADSGRR